MKKTDLKATIILLFVVVMVIPVRRSHSIEEYLFSRIIVN